MWYPMNLYGHYHHSSRPIHLTAPNGLNFSRSVGNPNSRLERVRKYLRDNGSRTKAEILRDVFNRPMCRGWGCYLFTYGVIHGFFRKERKGNTVLWSLT